MVVPAISSTCIFCNLTWGDRHIGIHLQQQQQIIPKLLAELILRAYRKYDYEHLNYGDTWAFTEWGRIKMSIIYRLQTTFINSFFLNKNVIVYLRFYWHYHIGPINHNPSLVLKCLYNEEAVSHRWCPIYRLIHASLSLDDLTYWGRDKLKTNLWSLFQLTICQHLQQKNPPCGL